MVLYGFSPGLTFLARPNLAHEGVRAYRERPAPTGCGLQEYIGKPACAIENAIERFKSNRRAVARGEN
jgi:hypothetical protein